MKTKFTLVTLFAICFSLSIHAQTPQGFNYQAVIRNAEGEPMANTEINVTFVISDAANLGYQFYSEEHTAVMTNEFGSLTLVIGEGDVTSDFFFHELNFGNTPFDIPYHLEIYVDSGNGAVRVAESNFQSVPYAIVAEDVEGVAWKQNGNMGSMDHFLGTTNATPFEIRTNNQPRLYIESGGKVGIGTENPEHQLDIQFNGSGGMRLKSVYSIPFLTLEGPSLGAIHFDLNGELEWMIDAGFNNSSDFVILNPHDDPFIGWTRPFCIQNQTGNVGIKTASPESSIHIQEGVDASLTENGWMMIGNVDGNNTIYHTNEIMARINGAAANLYITADGGAVAINNGALSTTHSLYVNGTAAKPGGGSWTATSDSRLKQNVQPYTFGLDEVMQIEPVSYHYIEQTGHDTSVEHVGVIAQDLQKISPKMVNECEMEMLDGVKGEYLNVDPSAFTYMLINGMKEQQKLIEAQQNQIEQLTSRIEAMEESQ